MGEEQSFGNYSFALKFKEVVKRIVRDEVDKIRPRIQYATVEAIDRVNMNCTVRYTGDTSTVKVNMGSIQPDSVGQIVRISGLTGDRYIEDVLGSIASMVPTASIISTARASAPVGWLICDGALVSRITYSLLFSTVGTTFGAGDGSTTFAIPNLKGRTLVGIDAAQAEFQNLGAMAGEKAHVLTVAELAQHSHGMSQDKWVSGAGAAAAAKTYTSPTAATGYTTDNSGSNAAHNNLQPYAAFNWLIKT